MFIKYNNNNNNNNNNILWIYIKIYGTSSISYIPVHQLLYRSCPVEKQHPPLLEPYFHLKVSATPPAIIERLSEAPFSKKCSMKRTGNICVDRLWLSNVVLLWTAVTINTQHGVHPTTLSLRISQILSEFFIVKAFCCKGWICVFKLHNWGVTVSCLRIAL